MNQLSRCVYLAHRDNLTTMESGECRWKLGKMSIQNETLRSVYARAVCRRSAIVRLNKDGHDHNPPIPSCGGHMRLLPHPTAHSAASARSSALVPFGQN